MIELIIERINRQIADYTQDLSSGSCEDHGAYRHITGLIHGLQQAAQICSDVLNKFETSDDE